MQCFLNFKYFDISHVNDHDVVCSLTCFQLDKLNHHFFTLKKFKGFLAKLAKCLIARSANICLFLKN